MVLDFVKNCAIRKTNITALALMVGLCGLISYAAHAASSVASSTCDPEYYQSLESRAWLEAQREITQNQNLIFKPDSVLEYSCFQGILNNLSGRDPYLFTGTDRWGQSPANLPGSLNAIRNSADNYLTSNFNHGALGGRSHNMTSTCLNMNAVWEAAKCMDFIDQSSYTSTDPNGNLIKDAAGNPIRFGGDTQDAFFTFSEYASDARDKRFLPQFCPKTADFLDNMQTALDDFYTPWEEDIARSYSNLVYPGSGCGDPAGPSSTGSMIKTGLVVETSAGVGPNNVTQFNEYICVVPGCHYEPTGLDSGSCVQ